jgi:ubiquinone/menaquinone biosynthesis C-methylase UbiE
MSVESTHRESILSHYETPQKLDDRLQLYQFGTGSSDWYQWVFQRLKLKPGDRILEIGCGNARLWQSRLAELPRDVVLVLSDFSIGMLCQARQVIGVNPDVSFQLIDAESLPNKDNSFDVIVANHMLYHVPVIIGAVKEMKRGLRSGGLLYTSAPSRTHLQELKDLLLAFDKTLLFPNENVLRFCMENGREQLEEFFPRVTLHVYTNEITVRSAAPIVRYVLSLFDGNQYPDLRGRQKSFEKFVQSRLKPTGSLTLTGVTGLFECARI